MSLSPNEKYPGRVAVDPNYQDGKFKDSDPSTANNGSPLKAIDRNEQLALQEAVMDAAGFEYSGVADTPQNSQMFKAYKAALSNGANLLSNHNFIIASPDDITHPNATPETYAAGTQIFSGVYAGDSGCTITFIDGRVNCTAGDYQFKVANANGLDRVPVFASSVSDYDGKPKTTGVSHALVGDEYVVTVAPAAGDVFSVKFEQGSVATGHDVSEQITTTTLASYTDIVYKASGGNSAVQNMIAGITIAASVGDICTADGSLYQRVSIGGNLDDFELLGSLSKVVSVGSGGDYQTINDAIKASQEKPKVLESRNLIQINLLSGFAMSEQVIIFNSDLGHIIITSDDPIVSINRSALNSSKLSYLSQSNFPAFGIMENSVGPVISCLFQMDSSGDGTNRTGILVNSNSFIEVRPGCGVTDVGHRGLHLSSSTAVANSAVFDRANDVGVRVGNQSKIWADNISAEDAGQNGCSVDAGGIASIISAKFNRALGVSCLNVSAGATATFTNGEASDGSIGISTDGGDVRFEGATITNNTDGNVVATDGSTLKGKLANLAGSTNGSGIKASNGCQVDIHGADTSDNAVNGAWFLTGTHGDVTGVTSNDNGNNALLCQSSSMSARSVTTGGSGGLADVRVLEGGTIAFSGTGTTNITVNTITPNGIIFN
ncbi:hypothetical protein [Vibrio phage H188]|nr:hypothetical protein [Vibrio phage H188]